MLWDELDLTELEGHTFECIDGCELCCLCQPEVMPAEASFFQSRYPERLVWKKEPYRHLAIATTEGGGPCTFLLDGRCEVYDHRPRFCRQYPFHFYLGHRAQAELDLSCRGVWVDGGEDAIAIAQCLMKESETELTELLIQTKDVYAEFWENCREAGVALDLEYLRGQMRELMGTEMSVPTLARMLEASSDEGEMTLPSGWSELSNKEMLDLEMAVMENSLDSLSAESIYSAPVYCDPRGSWHIFEVKGSEIRWQVMDRGGELHHIRSIDPFDVRIGASSLTTTGTFLDYMRTLNERDSFFGHVGYLEDQYGYEDYLLNVYSGALATSTLDLLWRTSLIGLTFEIPLGEELMREGIIFYDMDRLGSPTIGSFF